MELLDVRKPQMVYLQSQHRNRQKKQNEMSQTSEIYTRSEENVSGTHAKNTKML